MTKRYQSWGRHTSARHAINPVFWRMDPLNIEDAAPPVLPYGLGRSYGDCCLNDGGVLLETKRLNRFISFDVEAGTLRCEAGVTLEEILRLSVPRGWFLPVTPGTKFVTVGGAIANDVHGKNHHRSGTFGAHTMQFELLRSDGTRMPCSLSENREWFQATVGGLGLTGLITWAEIQLKPIPSSFLEVETVRFSCLDEFFELASASDLKNEYTVAWLDTMARGATLGRGLFIRGNHCAAPAPGIPRSAAAGKIRIPFDAPSFLLNRFIVRAFNSLYFHKQAGKTSHRVVHYDPFFYPLDAIGDWNRLYGNRGFFQYQCVVEQCAGREAIRAILECVAESGLASFLAVLKVCGDARSPGMLSFPRRGPTLALDFPNQGSRTLALLNLLDSIVRRTNGAVYPAKDARMASTSFQAYFPAWKEFERYIDPKFSSSFWRRVTGPSPGTQ